MGSDVLSFGSKPFVERYRRDELYGEGLGAELRHKVVQLGVGTLARERSPLVTS